MNFLWICSGFREASGISRRISRTKTVYSIIHGEFKENYRGVNSAETGEQHPS